MIKVLIIEDDYHFSLRTERIMKNYFKGRNELFQIEIKNSDFSSLEFKEWYDLIFLDIDLKADINGIDIAKKIRENQMVGHIIFVSCRQHLVFDTLAMQPLYFVRKSQYLKDMSIALDLISDYFKSNEKIAFNVRGRIVNVRRDEIYYIEIIDHDAVIYLRDTDIQITSSMEKLLEKLNDAQMIRIHRSFAVNVKYIDAIKKGNVYLINQKVLPIGRTFKSSFVEAYKKTI